MGRHDVPEQHVVDEPEPRERPVHDGRTRLRGPRPAELTFRGERDPADPRAAVAGRLADEDDRRCGARAEIRAQPLPPQRGARVLVVRRADARRGEAIDEVVVV
jgi:hypothetical protein